MYSVPVPLQELTLIFQPSRVFQADLSTCRFTSQSRFFILFVCFFGLSYFLLLLFFLFLWTKCHTQSTFVLCIRGVRSSVTSWESWFGCVAQSRLVLGWICDTALYGLPMSIQLKISAWTIGSITVSTMTPVMMEDQRPKHWWMGKAVPLHSRSHLSAGFLLCVAVSVSWITKKSSC